MSIGYIGGASISPLTAQDPQTRMAKKPAKKAAPAKKATPKKKVAAKVAAKSTSPVKKKKVKKLVKKGEKPAKAAVDKKSPIEKKKPVKRARGPKEVRLKAFWGVFNQTMRRVALFEFNERKKADQKAEELTKSGKSPHFVQPVKEQIVD
jgi:hypothetical protein